MVRVVVSLLVAVAATSWPALPPPAAIRPVIDHYPDGQTLTDPYRYFEQLKSPEVQRYFRRQADYTNAVLARLGPARVKLHADIERFLNAGSTVGTLVRVNDELFYLNRPVGANDARLMVRTGDAKPRVLLDPDALGKQLGVKEHLTISNVVPSPDGSRVALGIVTGGAERATHTRIIETATGALLPDDLPRSWFGPTAWSPDGTTLYYNQLPSVAPGHEAEAELNSQCLVHVVGSTSPDAVVFGIGHDPNVPFVPTDFPVVNISPASPWALGVIEHGVQNELTMYVAPVSAVVAGGAIPWRKIADVADDVTGFDVRGDDIYFQTHKNASNYKVTMLDMSHPTGTAATAKTLVPSGTSVIASVAVAKDGLYVRGIHGGPAELRKLPWRADATTGPIEKVALPFAGAMGDLTTDPRVDGANFSLESWTRPLLVYELDGTGTIVDTGIRKAPEIDTSGFVSQEVHVPSTGGVMVPVSIVMKRDAKHDGTNPTYLEAYGAYGLNIDPYFLGERFAWLDAGGIFVVAHVRGGGEYGEAWHLGGKGPTKQHTIDDAIATARYLIAQKYTSPAHLSIEGTSAGGIMVGGAITQHPELFAAALDGVGMTNAIRLEADANGPGNVPEFGTAKTAAGARALYAMDAYQHVVDGKHYPAVMGITGINDPRVPPWEVAKFVARLQHASASGRPVLLRVDYDAGHGLLGASRNQRASLLTDEFSFLLWQAGSPAYAGIPTHIVP